MRPAIAAATAMLAPSTNPMKTALMVPDASPISQPPVSAGVPQFGLFALAIRIATNTKVGTAIAVAMPARQPMPLSDALLADAEFLSFSSLMQSGSRYGSSTLSLPGLTGNPVTPAPSMRQRLCPNESPVVTGSPVKPGDDNTCVAKAAKPEPYTTPSFFCRLVEEVVYWNTRRLSG